MNRTQGKEKEKNSQIFARSGLIRCCCFCVLNHTSKIPSIAAQKIEYDPVMVCKIVAETIYLWKSFISYLLLEKVVAC